MQRNPMTDYLEDAQSLLNHMGTVANTLEDAIATARTAKQRAADATKTLAAAESELAAELAVAAMAKEGPLAGIATSSKAYQAVMDAELARARAGRLSALDIAAKRAQADAEAATIELEQAQARFSACRHAADLLAAMLHAGRI